MALQVPAVLGPWRRRSASSWRRPRRRAWAGGSPPDGESRKFVIDFQGGQAQDLPADAPVEAAVAIANGELAQLITRKNDVTGGWRYPSTAPRRQDPVELRCTLRLGDKALSETWVYQWTA